jgi:hypothetical protein
VRKAEFAAGKTTLHLELTITKKGLDERTYSSEVTGYALTFPEAAGQKAPLAGQTWQATASPCPRRFWPTKPVNVTLDFHMDAGTQAEATMSPKQFIESHTPFLVLNMHGIGDTPEAIDSRAWDWPSDS